MRSIFCVSLLLLAACAAPRAAGPKEYLDEQTAATITVVADPWIFNRLQNAAAPRGLEPGWADQRTERDFLNLYAIDVNRMGDHRQYLALLQWTPPLDASRNTAPKLQFHTGERVITLDAVNADPRSLGIAQPLAQAHDTSTWSYFAVDKQLLATIAKAPQLQLSLLDGNEQIAYEIWRDGRSELAELTEVLR
jgi:hypothetical protein